MKAWLITWEGSGGHAEPLDRVAGILSPRCSPKQVADIVEFLHARASCDLDEMAHRYAKVGSSNPWPAKIGNWERIECGHNPHLFARKVTDLEIDVDEETGLETITWTELPRYNATTEETEAEAVPQSYSRRITGPVSDSLVRQPSIRRLTDELMVLLRQVPNALQYVKERASGIF